MRNQKSNKELKKTNYNILDVDDYLENVKDAFELIQKENLGNSVSTLLISLTILIIH